MEVKIKGLDRDRKREAERLRRLNPGSYRQSGLHLVQGVIVAKGRKAAAKRAGAK